LPNFAKFATLFLYSKFMSQIKILFLGDVVGKIGRIAIKKILPSLKKTYKPDFIILNAENIAHGKGVTENTLTEMMDLEVDFFTSGNHIWATPEASTILESKKFPIIRPANYPDNVPGDGYRICSIGAYQFLIVNLMGQAFMKENFDNPILKLKQILEENGHQKISGVLVDFHGEATSEKHVVANFFDGQVSAFLGTHTHVQTADEKILPNGTAYITDVGMCGFANGSLGVDLRNVTKTMLTQISAPHEIPERGICQINGIFVIIKPENGKAQKIERISKTIEIK